MQSVFDNYKTDAYPYEYAIELHVDTIFAGVPADTKTVEWWIQSALVDNDELVRTQLAEIMAEREVGTIEEAVALAAGEKGLCVFRRDDEGLYIKGYQLKAAIKEAASVAMAAGKLRKNKWGETGKGLNGFVAEHIIVVEDRLHLGVPSPTGVDRGIVHTWRGSGFRANEYVDNVTLRATIRTDYEFSEKEWAMIWLTGQEQGIGANRSQGVGRYTVTRWERVTSTKRRRLTAAG